MNCIVVGCGQMSIEDFAPILGPAPEEPKETEMVETPKGGAPTSGESSFDPAIPLDQVYTSQPMTESFVHAPPEQVKVG